MVQTALSHGQDVARSLLRRRGVIEVSGCAEIDANLDMALERADLETAFAAPAGREGAQRSAGEGRAAPTFLLPCLNVTTIREQP